MKPAGAVRLHIIPMTYADACAAVARLHRHHQPPRGHKFSLGVTTPDGHLAGVAIVGRPVARGYDNGYTLEVTRVATDGTPNACSALYGAARRATRAMGYTRLITYTHDTETGASLRGAGWRPVAHRPARPGWNHPTRPRHNHHTDNTARLLWETTTPTRDETPSQLRDKTQQPNRCHCGKPLQTAQTGRPARHCSPACRQAAYRTRHTGAPR